MSNFNFDIALDLVTSDEKFPVNFDNAWQWLEYSRKDVAKKAFEKCGFVENVDYTQFRQIVELVQGGNTYKEVIKLTNECFKIWSMMSGTSKGKEVRRYYLECEKIAKEKEKLSPQFSAEILQTLQATQQLLKDSNDRLDQNQKGFKQAMAYISVLEEEKFDREFYLEKINEITKEHPLFKSLIELKMLIKLNSYSFPSLDYSIRDLSLLFMTTKITPRDLAFYSSHLYFLDYGEKPRKKEGHYTYSGKDLIYPLLVLFRLEGFSWEDLRNSLEIDYLIKFPTSNRGFLPQVT